MNKRLLRRTRSTLPGILANTDGGDAGGGAPAPAAAPAAPEAAAPAPAPAEQPAAPQAPAQEPTTDWDGKVESLPEPVQKMIRDLRQESADRRTKLTAAEQAQQDAIRALAKAAGIELPGGEDTAPKPEELAQQLSSSQQAQRDAAIELGVFKAATAPGVSVNIQRLTDSRNFMTKVQALDPAADDFAAQVTAAINEAVAADPSLKAGRAPGASSIDTTAGGSGSRAPRSSKPVPLDQAVSAHYGTA